MDYCNNRCCLKLRTCKNHIVNAKPNGTYNVRDYNNSTDTCDLYESITCSKCRKNQNIYARGLCKSCYYREHPYPKKDKHTEPKERVKREISPENIARKALINSLRQEGKTFEEIGILLGLSKQRVSMIHNKD